MPKKPREKKPCLYGHPASARSKDGVECLACRRDRFHGRKRVVVRTCPGCGNKFRTKNRQRLICVECKKDPKLARRARDARDQKLADQRDRKALRKLEGKPFRERSPLGAEALIEKWMRGEEVW